jgi:tRNA1Val (adenine37-N6)-methyltransferase
MLDETDNKSFNGGLAIAQPETGYRFSIDALILAHHITPMPGDRILDIGTGCGIIALLLARRYPETRIYGVELQPELARMAEANVTANHLADRIRIIERDIQMVSISETGPVQIITCNPPHIPKTDGRLSPNSQTAIARHEIRMSIKTLAESASRLLAHKGRLFTIYPAARLTDILLHLRQAGLEPKQIRAIHFKSDTPARRIIIQAVKQGQPGLEMAPPLFIHAPDGAYTPEAQAIMNPATYDRGSSPAC